jgi:hypothetical protein
MEGGRERRGEREKEERGVQMGKREWCRQPA